ncbi:MAG: GNVR domain-containing protein [Rubrivivax sp.]
MSAVAAGSLLLPKRYTATAAVAVDIKAPELFSSTNSLNAGWVPSYIATQVDVLMSELVALKAIDALGLDRQPQQREAWLKATKGEGEFRSWIAAELHKKLDVKATLQSNALYVAYTAPSPQLAADVANAVVRGYIAAAVDMRAEPTRQFTGLFDERSKKLREELEAAQARLSAYQRANGILAKDERLDMETVRLNELNAQLIALQAQVADSASRRDVASADPSRSPEVMNSSLVAGLTVDLNRQQQRLQELMTRLGDEHPQVIEARASISELRRRIAATSSQVSSGLASTDAVNRNRLAYVESALAAQRAKVLTLKERRDKVEVLMRDVENAQKAYDMVATRASQTSLESQSTQTGVTVLKVASVPTTPSSPLLALNLAIAAVVGLIVALGAAVLRESLDRRLRACATTSSWICASRMLGELADVAEAGSRRLLGWPRPLAALLGPAK